MHHRWTTTQNLLAATLLSALLLTGCYRAPLLDGPDQVYDPNIEVTQLKDNGKAALSWPEVDDYMESKLPVASEPGCAIGVARNDKVIYLEGYGKAKIGGADWGVGTMGAVGSVSKTFTAAAALRQHELGLLDVNDTVGDYLNTSNGPLGNARLYDLLAHSSGVGGATQGAAFSPDWENDSPGDFCKWNDDPGDAAYCLTASKFATRPSLAFGWHEASEQVANLAEGNPGAGIPDQGVYSNVGYGVLGGVIDQVAEGTDSGGYEAFVWDRIGVHTDNILSADNMLSLALSHSWRDQDIPNRAVGYQKDGALFKVFEAFDDSGLAGFEGWEGPAGGWVMTIGDLTRFAVALNSEQIVGSALLDAMRFNWTDLDGFGDNYGMGTFLHSGSSRPPYGHGGQIGGHIAMWGWWDDYNDSGKSLGITMMCNRTDISPWSLSGWAVEIAEQIEGTSPQVTSFANALPAVGERSVDGRSFALDLSKAWLAEPSGIALPIVPDRTLIVDTRAGRRGLEMTLRQGKRPSETESRGRAGRGQWLGAVDFARDPEFSTRPTDIVLPTRRGRIVVEDLILEGSFTKRGRSMRDVSLSGVLDTRNVGSIFGLEWNPDSYDKVDVCSAIGRAGGRCQPCDDGARACLEVRYEGLRARDL